MTTSLLRISEMGIGEMIIGEMGIREMGIGMIGIGEMGIEIIGIEMKMSNLGVVGSPNNNRNKNNAQHIRKAA
jgi:predicted homoserine dehydrogenase-like protein